MPTPTSACTWLAAWVRALVAERRATNNIWFTLDWTHTSFLGTAVAYRLAAARAKRLGVDVCEMVGSA